MDIQVRNELLILKQLGFTDKTLYEIFNNEAEIMGVIYNKGHPFYNKYYDIYSGKEKELSRDSSIVEKFMETFIKKMRSYKKRGIKIIYRLQDNFPIDIFDKEKIPLFLYCYGDLSLLEKQYKKVSIVGTREPKFESIVEAQNVTRKYVEANYVTVSGLALGIDTVVHQETLKNNGKTICVLPCTLDKIYPKDNENLFNEIVNNSGLAITTIGPFEHSYKSSFLDRNSIIANFAEEVLVVEASIKSGSLNTVRKATEKGKETFYIEKLLETEVIEYIQKLGGKSLSEKRW